jgi:hypothetical protein
VTTISYDRPVEDLIAGLSATGHVTHTSCTKTSVTLHHNGGVGASREDVLNTWKSRQASAHFDVDGDGNIAQFVKVDEIAWGVGDWAGNQATISIEMADATGSPSWQISDATLASATRLAAWLFVHVVGQRPSPANFFPHQHWTQTDCPGPFVMAHWSSILASVQTQYDQMTGVVQHVPVGKTVVQLAHEVIQGLWGNGQDRINKLTSAGYDAALVQSEVNHELGASRPSAPAKSISLLAHEVIRGEWGNGLQRTQKLTAAGYDARAVQAEVNRLLR